jgi:hypothetical protein
VGALLCTIVVKSCIVDFLVIYGRCATLYNMQAVRAQILSIFTMVAPLCTIFGRSEIIDFVAFTVDAALCTIFGMSRIVNLVVIYGGCTTLHNIWKVWDSRFCCHLLWMRYFAQYL